MNSNSFVIAAVQGANATANWLPSTCCSVVSLRSPRGMSPVAQRNAHDNGGETLLVAAAREGRQCSVFLSETSVCMVDLFDKAVAEEAR